MAIVARTSTSSDIRSKHTLIDSRAYRLSLLGTLRHERVDGHDCYRLHVNLGPIFLAILIALPIDALKPLLNLLDTCTATTDLFFPPSSTICFFILIECSLFFVFSLARALKLYLSR
ncbi:hypothetical protein B0H34DRAFT_802355 [Crassisporium funariophilum]|nr:hypothetical protein B0H34DRAFT_802355 [Crassisporium funariophilum]